MLHGHGRGWACSGSTLFAAALLSVFGCGGEARVVELGADDGGETIELAEGDSIRIRLESNPSTGFRWNLVEEPAAAVLEASSSEYVAPEDGLIGQGGVEEWTFVARGGGTTSLTLRYFRPFDPADVQGSFELRVEVG